MSTENDGLARYMGLNVLVNVFFFALAHVFIITFQYRYVMRLLHLQYSADGTIFKSFLPVRDFEKKKIKN